MNKLESITTASVIRNTHTGKLYRIGRAMVVSDDDVTLDRAYALEPLDSCDTPTIILACEIGPRNKFEVVEGMGDE